MNGFTSFLGNSQVHDTVLLTMVISSFLAAIRRFRTVDNTPIAPGVWAFIKLLWNFFYDWAVGFWSMKTGQPPVHPLENANGNPPPNPLASPAAPAQTK